MDRASAAVARVAADVRSCEPEVVAKEVDEEPARRNVLLDPLAVDLNRDPERRGGLRRQR
jgi:hypothetical protein